jgi:glycosyltransferase involved in cell wall biosynthesis
MTSCNHERFIAEAIESVLQQDFKDLELIIVDDASTDASRQIIERYAEQDPRIRVISHERNLGISKGVNDGIDTARGKFVAQIDSDDVWVKEKLRKQLAILESNGNVIVWSEGELIGENGNSLGKTFSETYGSLTSNKSGAIFQDLIAGNYIFGSSLLFKRQNIGDLRYDEGLLYLNDYKFQLALARKCKFYFIAEPLAKYRVHGSNTLASSGPGIKMRRRRAYIEEIAIRRDAVRGYDGAVPAHTMAKVYASNGFCYGRLGENKEALRSYLRAIRSDPLSRSWIWLVQEGLGKVKSSARPWRSRDR